MIKTIYFRNENALRPYIGQWSVPGLSITVGQDSIDAFAELSGDRNWLHVDVDRCRHESPFGAPVAHGMLILSLLPRLAPEEAWRLNGYRQAVNRGLDRVRFLSPLRAGSTVRCRVRLKSVTVGERGTDLVKEFQVFEENPDQPLMVAEFVLRYS